MSARLHWRKTVSNLMLTMTGVCAFVSVAILFLILGYLVYNGGTSINWAFFTQLPKPVGEVGGGMANAIVGSAKLLLAASVFGVPIGFLGGIYLAEFSGAKVASVVRYAADLLNGVPSIVIGIFAYSLAVIPFRQFSTLAGAFALGMMMIPITLRSTEEFLGAVPRMLREGAMALGASKWKTISTVIVPAAYRGILTAILLALARVAGETAPLLFTALGNRYWSPGLEPANGVTAGDDLQLRELAVRGLASSGVGSGTGAARVDSDHQHISSNDSIAGHRGAEVVEMQSLPNQGISVNINAPTGATGAKEHATAAAMRMTISKVSFYYGIKQILFDINMGIADKKVTALIGPSGCGKSTLLRTLNRMHETVNTSRLEGEILLDQQNILAQDVTSLRRRIGMVFQRPNPFPKSIFENVAYGPRINGFKGTIAEVVERSLRNAALWEEVKDHLHKSAYELSGGQQQRLCIARALAVEPEVLLLDEPCSALDPISTAKIEELLVELKNLTTLAIVTHNMQQAARVSDFTAFLLTGQLIEFSPTPQLFTTPGDPRTEAYITGRFG